MTPEINVEPVLIMENLDNEEIEQMINNIRKGEKERTNIQTGRTNRQNWTEKL